jgi:hypothetical protein
MNKLTILATLFMAALLSACDNGTPPQQKTSATASTSVDLKVGNWGPQSTKVGVIPNQQPDGGMGIWIEVSGTQGLGEAQVLFGGQPAMVTSVQEKGITASIAPEQLTELGKKELVIKQIATNKLFPVGVFDVQSAK